MGGMSNTTRFFSYWVLDHSVILQLFLIQGDPMLWPVLSLTYQLWRTLESKYGCEVDTSTAIYIKLLQDRRRALM